MTRKRRILFLSLCLILASCLLPLGVHAEFYKYVDESGKTIFVDDPAKIPPEYREDTKSYKEKYDDLSESERVKMLEKEKKALEEFRKEEIEKARAYVSRETKVVVQGNQVLVPVVLAYEDREVEVVLLLDTGASIIALHRDVANRLRIRNLQKGWARGAGGREIATDIAVLSYVRVGPHKRENLMAGIIDFQGAPVAFEGLLGMNFLRGLEYDIDFEEQRIKWKR